MASRTIACPNLIRPPPRRPPGPASRHPSPVVQVPALPVLDPGPDLPLGRAITLQLIGHDHTREILRALQQLLEEALGRLGAAPALDQDVEHDAVLVDRPPEVVALAADADEDLAQVTLVPPPRPALLERVGEHPPEAQAPGADALVAHHHATFGQDRLDLAQAQAEAVVEPYGVADDLGREAEAAVRVGGRPHARHPATPLRPTLT